MMDLSSFPSSSELAETLEKLNGIDSLNSSESNLSNTTFSDKETTERQSIFDTETTSCNNIQHFGGQILYWSTMASVPGGPPMASGAAESDLGLDAGNREARGQGLYQHGARMQLFREQPMAGSPDGAASANQPVTPKAPPPDVVQSQMEARHFQNPHHAEGINVVEVRQRQALDEEDGQVSNAVSAQSGLDPVGHQMALSHGPSQMAYQLDMMGLDPEGQNVHDLSGPASWPGIRMNGSGMQNHQSMSINPSMNVSLSVHGQLSDMRIMSLSAGHEGTSVERQSTTNTNGNLGTGYVSNNIQITVPEENNSFGREDNIVSQEQEFLPDPVVIDQLLEHEGRGSHNESLESGMYVEPDDLDLSEEFLPLENDEPEGAGSSSQSNDDCDLAYEDNTEVDQDVILQPEADQTSYDESTEVRSQLPVSRVSAFHPIAGGYGNQGNHGNRSATNNSAPIYIPPRTVPLNFNPSGTLQSSGYHVDTARDTHRQKVQGGQQGEQERDESIARMQCQISDVVQGNGSTKPEEDQLLSDLVGDAPQNIATESTQNQAIATNHSGQGQENDALLIQGSANPVHSQLSQSDVHRDQLQGQPNDSPPEGAVGGANVRILQPNIVQIKSNVDTVPEYKETLSDPGGSRSQTLTGAMGRGEGAQSKQTLVVKPKSSTESGTNAGKQHNVRGVSRIPKTQNGQAKRTKIRTLPPKAFNATTGKQLTPKNKPRPMTSSQNKPSVNMPEHLTQSRSSTNAKSPNRQPPQRQAPSGGDSTSTSVSQSQGQYSQHHGQNSYDQGQGHVQHDLQQAISGGQYMLSGPQCTASVTRPQGIYLDSRMTQLPTHSDPGRDCADGFMRPNPIGETDAGVRPAQGMSLQGNNVPVSNVMLPIRQPPVNVAAMNGQLISTNPISNMMSGDGDGDETSSLASQPTGRQPMVMHPHQQNMPYNYFSRAHDQMLEREVPGTSIANSQFTAQPIQVHAQQMTARILSPVYQPSLMHSDPQSHQPLNLYYHGVDTSHPDSVQNRQISNKSESYMLWDQALELSPISRASGATDRIQTTAQTSPGASSNRDTANNISFMSVISERQQQQQQQQVIRFNEFQS